MIDIRNIQGNVIYSTEINQGAKRKFQLMKEDYITLPFSLAEPKKFELGCYVDIDAGLFEIVDAQKPTLNASTGGYDYQLRLDAYYWKWKNKIFKYTPENGGQEASWSITATLGVHLQLFLNNLYALGYKYRGTDFEFSIDSTVENSAKVLTYENVNMIDALSMLAEAWECEWWITDNIIHFGRCEYGTPVDFEIDVNVSEMSRSESSSNYATRLYVFGSTRNLPTNYRPIDENVVVNGVVQRRLMLPSPYKYIDAYEGMSQEEAIEEVVILEDVYPKTDGNISSVETYTPPAVENEDGTTTEETFYRFKDNGIKFSKDYILEGQELRAVFTSGSLNGMEFGLVFNPNGKDESSNEAQLFEIVASEDYGRKLPDATLHPNVGDKYVLIGWDSTKIADLGLVSKAEEELYKEGLKLSAKRKIDPNTYGCKMFSDYMYGLDPNGKQDSAYSKHFDVGDRVNLINAAYFDNGRQSRIIGYEYNLDIPFDSPTYTVGETASYSRLGALESKLDALTYGGQTYTGKGGSGVYVIGSNDVTKATDRNVYSALRSDKNYLSKTKDDRSKGVIASDKGFHAGEFVSGAIGVGVYQNADGQWVIETDNLAVRRKFSANEVEIQATNHIGGQTMLTAARMQIESVEDMADRFRCFFRKRDGEGNVIQQEWKVGDLAFCNTFNLEKQADGTIGNHYYWREVVGVSDDKYDDYYHYVELSKDVCASGSNAPKAGDKVVQLGYSKSDDADRQNAIIIAGAGVGSPYIQIFEGISGFELPEPDQLKPGDNRLSGRLTIKAGSTGWENLAGLPEKIEEAMNSAVDLDGLEYGKNNLLLNSGFTGDFVTASLSGDSMLKGGSKMFSPSLKYWKVSDNVVVEESEVSESGYEVFMVDDDYLEQTLLMRVVANDNYIFSFRGKGGAIRLTFGEVYHQFDLDDENWGTYSHKFQAPDGVTSLRVEAVGDCSICELQLERGTVRSAWGMSPLDNRSELAKYESMSHIRNLLKSGGLLEAGVVNTGLITMGRVNENGELTGNTAGISGQYNDDDSVAYWAGGDYEQALYAIATYLDNPNYTPTKEELNNMAKFVVTHGGRAILNDVILRGYIYALGGKFKGEVEALSGVFNNVSFESGELGSFIVKNGVFGMLDSNGSISANSPMAMLASQVLFRSSDRLSRIGLIGSGYEYLGEFKDTRTQNIANRGIEFDIRNSYAGNFAFCGNGTGVLNGLVCGYKIKSISATKAETYVMNTIDGNQYSVKGGYVGFYLGFPKIQSVWESLGYSVSDYTSLKPDFCTPITVINLTSYDLDIRGRNTLVSGMNSTDYPEGSGLVYKNEARTFLLVHQGGDYRVVTIS